MWCDVTSVELREMLAEPRPGRWGLCVRLSAISSPSHRGRRTAGMRREAERLGRPSLLPACLPCGENRRLPAREARRGPWHMLPGGGRRQEQSPLAERLREPRDMGTGGGCPDQGEEPGVHAEEWL